MRFLQRSFEISPSAHRRATGLSQRRGDQEGSPQKEGDKEMGIRQTLKKWAAYQQTVRELASLDNRQLNDLGISRADIQKIARDHARSI
jgi:uncharacterized protein YjiS (DUF1127 family)